MYTNVLEHESGNKARGGARWRGWGRQVLLSLPRMQEELCGAVATESALQVRADRVLSSHLGKV